MIAAVTREGLGRSAREPRLAITVWLVNLALAAAAGVPSGLALASVIGDRPEADVLADRLSLGVVADLVEMRPGLLEWLGLTALGVAFLGLLAGAAVAGGVLEVLVSRDERAFGHRFGRGAGRFFGRFLRAGLVAVTVGGTAALLAALPFLGVRRALRDSGWELGRPLLAIVAALAALLVFLLALLALDAARILVVRDDRRRVGHALLEGARLVLGHPATWLGVWAVNALGVGLALVAYLTVRGRVEATTGWLLGATLLLQQAFVLARSALRVSLLASEVALVDRLRGPQAAAGHPEPLRAGPVAVV